jgi:hypothetical protein
MTKKLSSKNEVTNFHPQEIRVFGLTDEKFNLLLLEAETLGSKHVEALRIQRTRQSSLVS